MTIANGERSKLRRFLMDGTMERYRNGTVKDRNGIGPKRTERQRTGNRTGQKRPQRYRSNTGEKDQYWSGKDRFWNSIIPL